MIDDNQAKRNIAANLARLLEAREWTQSALARMIDEDQPRISQLLRAQHMPGAGLLARIAEAFDVSVDRLLGTPPEENSVDSRKSA